MTGQRALFLRHLAQTSTEPLSLEISHALGCTLYGPGGKTYIDLISGISVSNLGHGHPKVLQAIHDQSRQYLHLMVYGELVLSPQVAYAKRLSECLPAGLDSVYFTNSGTEAAEGAMKLAKRATGRPFMAGFQFSYHGSTQGALSIMGDEYWRNAFRPLLPGIRHLRYDSMDDLARIDSDTACVMAETVQAEQGVLKPSKAWMQSLRQRCTETGTLLILDEIQTGFGRTGTLWAFEQYDIVPDIILLGKALGAGMPMGAFVASQELMSALAADPVLGHITTFGGHALCCAAGLAGLNALSEEGYIAQVPEKSALFQQHLRHPLIKSIRHAGLLMAIEFDNFAQNKRIIDACLRKGLFTDWFLFASQCMRIAPPLTISADEVLRSCHLILEACDEELQGLKAHPEAAE